MGMSILDEADTMTSDAQTNSRRIRGTLESYQIYLNLQLCNSHHGFGWVAIYSAASTRPIVLRSLRQPLVHQSIIDSEHCSDLILAVLHAYPEAAKYRVSLANGLILPLIYYAIEEGCSDDVLLALLNANISAAKMKDRFGSSLLQRVIDSKHSSDLILAVLHAWL
jgi:hypothetical protein